MTNWLEPGEYKAKQDKAQLGLLDEMIRDLAKVYQHKIGRLNATEKTEMARGQLYTCLQNLMDERNERTRRAERAATQIEQRNYEQRLLASSSDYYDMEVMPDIDE